MSGIVIMFFQSQAVVPPVVVAGDGTLSGASFMEVGFGG